MWRRTRGKVRVWIIFWFLFKYIYLEHLNTIQSLKLNCIPIVRKQSCLLFCYFFPPLCWQWALAPCSTWSRNMSAENTDSNSTLTPQDGLYWVVSMAYFPYCVQGKCRSGRRGSAEATCSSIASLKLAYSNVKSATQACVCNAVLGSLCLDFIIIILTTFLSSPLNLKVSANSVAEVWTWISWSSSQCKFETG